MRFWNFVLQSMLYIFTLITTIPKKHSTTIWSKQLPVPVIYPRFLIPVFRAVTSSTCLRLSAMLQGALLLWLNLAVVERIHPQSNKFAMGIENKATGNSKLTDGPAILVTDWKEYDLWEQELATRGRKDRENMGTSDSPAFLLLFSFQALVTHF